MNTNNPIDGFMSDLREFLAANWKSRDDIAKRAEITPRHLRSIRDGKANPTAEALRRLHLVKSEIETDAAA